MQPLSADFVTLTPNPFSPLRSSLKISYVLNSKSGSSVETTIKVFNMADKLIRTIEDRQLKNTGTVNTDTWDGKDEHGKWAANGRYIVQFEIKDTSNTKQYLYSVALVK
jgi:flagellar hook assembly protein FlgD